MIQVTVLEPVSIHAETKGDKDQTKNAGLN